MANYEAQNYIVTNGLVLNLDAGDPDSYTRSQPPYVEVLVVAGGGSGGGSTAGGGGAGGLIYNSAYQLTSAAAVTVTVGAGGAGVGSVTVGNDGSNSVFGSLTAIGGGGGGMTNGSGGAIGRNGGSGGGGAHYSSMDFGTPGTGTPGQGNNGGDGSAGDQNNFPGGGGGGAGAVGGDPTNSKSGNGGNGLTFSISGTSTTYAGGGGGGSSTNGGDGGTGGGGAGTSNGYGGTAGTANTGGGGGGGWYYGGGAGGAGGSGIVIVRYPGLPAATGGTITYLNGYTIHTFTSSGTFTPYKWNDLSGGGRNGTLVNGVSFVPNRNGGYLVFDGTDDYVDGISNSGITHGTDNFSYFAWVNLQGKPTYGTIFENGSWTSCLLIRYQTNGIAIYSMGSYWGFFDFNPPLSTWNYLGFIRRGNSLEFYINGVYQTSLGFTANISPSSNIFIGTSQHAPNQCFNGYIPVAQIYTRALSTSEITQNFNAQYSRFGVGLPSNGLIVNLDASNLSSYPGTGTIWYDVSGTGNNAVLANGVSFSSANGGIFDFDGVDDYAYIVDNATLDLSGDKTQGIWLYMDQSYSGTGILGKADSSVNGMALTYGWGGGQGFQNIAWNSSNSPTLVSNGADINNWYYVAGVQDGGTRYIYVIGANGYRVASSSGGNHTWNNALNFTIGTIAGYYTNMKAGAVHVYNRALSAGEISAIYATQKSRFNLP